MKVRVLLTEFARSGDQVSITVIVGERQVGTITLRAGEWHALKERKAEVFVGEPLPLVAGNTRT